MIISQSPRYLRDIVPSLLVTENITEYLLKHETFAEIIVIDIDQFAHEIIENLYAIINPKDS
jgi:hypothetical protein